MKARQGFTRRVSRILRFYYLRLVRIDDSPEKIAGGVALGIFLGVFPTFGLGLLLAVALASSFHVSRAAALIGSVIMNPITSPLFWGLCAFVGAALFGVDNGEIVALAGGIEASVKGWFGAQIGFDLGAVPAGNPWPALFGRLGLAYLAGSTVVSAVFALGGYFVTKRLAVIAHQKRVERRHRRALRRAEAARAREARSAGARPKAYGADPARVPSGDGPADIRPGA